MVTARASGSTRAKASSWPGQRSAAGICAGRLRRCRWTGTACPGGPADARRGRTRRNRRFAPRRPVRPFWPSRASSSHRSCSALPGWAAWTASGTAARFSMWLLRRGVGLGAGGPRRLPRQAHAAQHPRQGRQPVGHSPALLDAGRDVEQAAAARAVRLRVRPGQHPGPQPLPLRRGQLLRPPWPRAAAQPRQPLGIVAQHRVAQRLALPSHDPDRVRPARSFQGLRDGQRPQRRTPVRLAPREPPQLRRAYVVSAKSQVRFARDRQAACFHHPLCAEQTERQPHFSHAASHVRIRSWGNWYYTRRPTSQPFWSKIVLRL